MRRRLARGGIVLSAGALFLFSLLVVQLRKSLPFGRDDDWSYVATSISWAQGEGLDLNGWVHMFFLGQGWAGEQVVLLFSEPFVSLHMLVLTFGVLGLISLWAIAGHLLSSRWSLLVVFLVGLGPLWLHLSVTFMTDIPMWSLALLSVLAVYRGTERDQPAWFALAGALGLAAFSVREYGVIPVVVMLAFVLLHHSRPASRIVAIVVLVAVVVASLIAYQWRVALPGSVTTEPLPLIESFGQISRLFLTLAFFLAPVVVIVGIVLRPTAARILGLLREETPGALIGILVALGLFVASGQRLLGNVIHPYGSSWTSVGDGVRAVPGWFYVGLVLIAFLSLSVVSVSLGAGAQRALRYRIWLRGEWWTQQRWTVGALTVVAVGMLASSSGAVLLVGAPVFDRYLLMPASLLMIVMFWWALQHQGSPGLPGMRCWVGTVVVVSTGVGIIFVDASNQVDGLRWQVASELVEGGIPAYKIDGGDAWFRYHQKDAPGVAQVGSLENSLPGRTWWQTFFEGSTFCRMIAIESETDLQAMYGPALSIDEERTLLGTPFRVMVFPGPDPCEG